MTHWLAHSALTAFLLLVAGCASTSSADCACCDLHRQGQACTGKACR
jgi:hypothetical protein